MDLDTTTTTGYPIMNPGSAPESTRPALEVLGQTFGFVPNLAGAMANSPTLMNTFFAAFGQFRGGTFSPAERQVLLLTNAVVNDCPWSVAFHSHLADEDGVPPVDVAAIRAARLPADPRSAALSRLTRSLIDRRGRLDDGDVTAFLAAGFDRAQLLEVITGVAISALTNYAANVIDPPVEEPLRSWEWRPGY